MGLEHRVLPARDLGDGAVHVKRQRRWRTIAIGAFALAVVALIAGPSSGVGFLNWPGYLFGADHPSVNTGATSITAANVGTLHSVWHWHPPNTSTLVTSGLFATPAVYNGRVFEGSNNGNFYALDESTGHQLWSQFLGFVQHHTCGSRGITSSATVTTDPVTGAATVYVAGGDGYMYALDAATGAVVWKSVVGIPSTTVNDYYNWASPAVYDGHVYMGVSSQCDAPFVPGGLIEYDQHTGEQQARYYSMPTGVLGGGVWSSPAVADDGVYITTASPCPKTGVTNWFSCAIVALDRTTLAQTGGWVEPASERVPDADFGGSPVMFTANLNGTSTPMVAACNKNGVLYGMARGNVTAGPVWRFQVGLGTKAGQLACLSAPVWDGQHLFMAGNQTTINGVAYRGSIRELDPDTGTATWETGLSAIVLGSPSMNGNGILAVSTYDSSGARNNSYFIDSSNGQILHTIPPPKNFSAFAQPIFADNYVFLTTMQGGIYAYTP